MREAGGGLGEVQKRLAISQGRTLGKDLPKSTWYYRLGNFIEKVRRGLGSSVPQSEEGHRSSLSVGKFYDE